MHRLLSSCLAIAVLSPLALYSQKTGSAASTPSFREYRLQALYRAGIAQNYEITERDSVVRTHSDSSKKTYQRTVTYFTTARCLESMDGFSTVSITLDSMLYAFESEGIVIDYDSQKEPTPKNFGDLFNYTGPMNRSFELRYNPYGEIQSVQGEQITWLREYLAENMPAEDSVRALIWQQSVDDENLLHYGDFQKNAVPGTKIGIDSSWTHPFLARIDGVLYKARATSKLLSYSGGYFTIRTKDTIPAVADQRFHVYGVPAVSRMDSGSVAIDQTIRLATTGTVQEVTQVAHARFVATVENERYRHDVHSTTSWKLIGQYQW